MAQVGAHGEVGDGSDEGDADGDVVKHPMRACFGEGMRGKGECSCQHHGTHGLCIIGEHHRSDSMWDDFEGTYKVPVRAMSGDANVRNSPVDAMGDGVTVDDDGTIAHLCDCFTKSRG